MDLRSGQAIGHDANVREFYRHTQEVWQSGVLDELGDRHRAAALAADFETFLRIHLPKKPDVLRLFFEQFPPEPDEFLIYMDLDSGGFIATDRRLFVRGREPGSDQCISWKDVQAFSKAPDWSITTKDGGELKGEKLLDEPADHYMEALVARGGNWDVQLTGTAAHEDRSSFVAQFGWGDLGVAGVLGSLYLILPWVAIVGGFRLLVEQGLPEVGRPLAGFIWIMLLGLWFGVALGIGHYGLAVLLSLRMAGRPFSALARTAAKCLLGASIEGTAAMVGLHTFAEWLLSAMGLPGVPISIASAAVGGLVGTPVMALFPMLLRADPVGWGKKGCKWSV